MRATVQIDTAEEQHKGRCMLLVLEEVLEGVLEELRTKVCWSNYETKLFQW